jgi:hypothetical protein
MLSVSARRLEMLNKAKETQDTYEAVKWLQERGGKQRFKGEIYLPPILSLGVKDPSLAATVESCFRPGELHVTKVLFFVYADV